MFVHMRISLPLLHRPPSFCWHFPPISVTLFTTSSRSPHPPSRPLKSGGGAGRTHVNGLRRSVPLKTATGVGVGRPALTAKPPCWKNRPSCSLLGNSVWSRARLEAGRSSPSPCTCQTCPPSWTRTVTSASPIWPRCASSRSARNTSCPLNPHHSSRASCSSSSSCLPRLSPSLMPSRSPSLWPCASATWSPRPPPWPPP